MGEHGRHVRGGAQRNWVSRGPGWGQSALLGVALALTLGGCFSDQDIFTQGRVEDLCAGVVPICHRQAGCVMDDTHFASGAFPGEFPVVAHSDTRDATLRVRILLTDMVYPGTELLVQAHSPDCGDAQLEHLVDIDLFDYAGDDRILDLELALPEAGDHLVEIYSDMAAEYLLTVDVEERP